MKFRTEVNLKQSELKINNTDSIFSMGSCFSTEISEKLKTGQIQTCNNPFGTIFNPFSINSAVKRLHDAEFYKEEDLVSFNGNVLSLDHHSSFNSRFVHQTLNQINHQLENGNQFLRKSNFILITYGTSFVYEFLPKKKLVANCHKIPAKHFEKRLLTNLELTDSIYETILNLKDIAQPNVQILFTVSPVRHTRDGLIENNLSKAKLINALHEILPQFENCHYLPIYEMMLDDLRDYRFYKEDMIHPNSQAINYIWEKFIDAWFADETKEFITENFKISRALEHRPADEKDPKHLEFLENLKSRILAQKVKVKHEIF